MMGNFVISLKLALHSLKQKLLELILVLSILNLHDSLEKVLKNLKKWVKIKRTSRGRAGLNEAAL